MIYVAHKTNGEIIGTCPSRDFLEEALPGVSILEWTGNVTPRSHWVNVAQQAVEPKTTQEMDQQNIDFEMWKLRATRNRLLAKCDWTQVPDAPVNQAAWKVYRQALRDMPANTTDPANPVWPAKPGDDT